VKRVSYILPLSLMRGLRLWLPLKGGFSVADRGVAGNLHPATLQGDAAIGLNGMACDGTGDYASLSVASDINFSGRPAMTLNAWVYSSLLEDFDGILDDSQGSGTTTMRHGISLYQNKLRFVLGTGAAVFQAFSAAVLTATSTWYHVLATCSGTALQCYVNGAASGSPVSLTADITASANGWNIGRAFATDAYSWHGNLRDAMIWDRALDATEAKLAATWPVGA